MIPPISRDGNDARCGRLGYVWAALSGLVLAVCQSFALPIGDSTEWGRSGWLDYVAWAGLVPLCLWLRSAALGRSFRLGFVAGLVYFGTVLYWLVWVMDVHGGIPLIGAIPILLLLVSFLALFWGLAGYLSVRLAREFGVDHSLALPVVWVVLEFLRNYLLTGFGWANPGYTQVRSLWLAQLASLGGVYLVAFFVVWTNASLARWFVDLRNRRFGLSRSLIAWLVSMVFAGVWGTIRLSADVDQGSRQVMAAVIQGNLDEKAHLRGVLDEMWVWDRMGKLSRKEPASDLIVWPEGSLPQSVGLDMQSLRKQAHSWIRLPKATLVIGAIGRGLRSDGARILTNSAFVVDGNLDLIGRYDKRHLVPFGEYVPWSWLLPYEWFVPEGVSFFDPGPAHSPISTPLGSLGMLICYEAIFPEIARETVQEGAQLLVNITNDSWFGPTSSPYQHLTMSIMRSIETDRFQVRAANTGISAVVDPRGRELIRSSLGLANSSQLVVSKEELLPGEVLTHFVRMRKSRTLYVLCGDWFAWMCTMVCLATLVWHIYRRRKKKN